MPTQESELWAYSIQGRKEDQEEGLCAMMQWRAVSKSWFALSVCPLDYGWYPDVKLQVVPIALQNARQTWDVNCGPWSETMSVGSQCSLKTWRAKRSAVSAADRSLVSGMYWTIFEKRSMIVRMVVWPLEDGSPDQGRLGMGRGNRRPAGGWWDGLLLAHTMQAATNLLTSLAWPNHQKCSRKNRNICWAPGWQLSLDECPHWRTLARTSSGMNRRLWGPVPGSGWECWAPWTTVSISQVLAPVNRGKGTMGSGSREGV